MEMNIERSVKTRELLRYAILVNLDEKIMCLFVTLCLCVSVRERRSGLVSLEVESCGGDEEDEVFKGIYRI